MADLIKTPARSIDELGRIAKAFAQSNMFGVKTTEQAFSLLMIAESEGLHPARAMQEYHVINGRPSLRADAMLGRYQVAGGKVEWVKHSDEEVVGKFTHEASGTVQVSWDKSRAQQAGILGNQTWKKYPRQMLRARVISEGVRLSYPACITGFYAPEEMESFDPTPIPEAPQKALPNASVSALDQGDMSNREVKQAVANLEDSIAGIDGMIDWDAWPSEHEGEVNALPEDYQGQIWSAYQAREMDLKAREIA